MNEETRICTEIETANRRLVADNAMLRTQVAQMRQTIADYERAHAVAEAMAKNNELLPKLLSQSIAIETGEQS